MMRGIARFTLRKSYPDRWSFYLDEIALYAFGLLVVTGVWLTFAYHPNARDAYASVVALSRAGTIGSFVRQVHHWSAVTFVAAVLVHVARAFFLAAFRGPRKVQWIIGVTMLFVGSLAGFTGYALPYDALSGTGLRIADAIVLAVPFVGTWASDALTGGGYPGPLLLQHLSAMHVYVFPVIIVLLLAASVAALARPSDARFSHNAIRALAKLGLTAVVIFALAATVEINPIAAYGPYNDWTVPNPAVPEWYASWLDGALRLGPALEISVLGHPIPAIFWPGVVLPAIVAAALLFWPWIETAFTRNRIADDAGRPTTFAPWRVGLGSGVIAFAAFLALASSDDQQALALHQPVQSMVTFYRLLVPFGSVGVGLAFARITRELRARSADRGSEGQRVIALRRNAAGGFDEEAIGPA